MVTGIDACRYYGHQKFTDANTEIWKKDETKRRDREMREHQMEEKALEKLMQVSRLHSLDLGTKTYLLAGQEQLLVAQRVGLPP